jgi:hypothetical protein
MNNDNIPLDMLTQEQYINIMKKVRLVDNQRGFMKTYSKTAKGKAARSRAMKKWRAKKKTDSMIKKWLVDREDI